MLTAFCDWLIYEVMGLSPDAPWAGVIHFFIYDSIKIILLLFVMIAVIGFIRTFLPQEKIRQMMNRGGAVSNFCAALFGAITPFCSCSSIPLFLGFLKAGAPLGVTLSFLITSPLINEYLVVLMVGFFGWKITALYVVSGLILGTSAGLILGRLGLEKYLEKDLFRGAEELGGDRHYPTLSARLRFGIAEAVDIVKKVWLWILVGVGLGAVVHNYVPQEAIDQVIATAGIWDVPLATLIGTPIYGSCVAIVPIAIVIFQKGVPLGTALALMMAISALSLPEAIMLRRAMQTRLIVIFFGITIAGIIFTGYVFNFFQSALM